MKKLLVPLAVLTVLFWVLPSHACFTIVAGKKATADGSVLFAHNEDDRSPVLFNVWYVPRRQHNPGEVVRLRNGGSLPQVPETWGYFWIEAVGLPFSDYGMNEWGVTVASNACPSVVKPEQADLTDGGIGYMLRLLVLQRAKTAREGVKIAGELLDRFGYASSGRTLTIADANEAWLLAMVRGKHWVAERVPDDQVVVQPNIFVIRKVNFSDKKNFIFCKDDIRKYAAAHGWYNPEKGPFDFANVFAYFYDPKYAVRGYDTRQWRGQQLISGKTVSTEEAKANGGLPFSVRPAHPLTVADLFAVLRDHYEGTPYDVTREKKGNPNSSFERTICTASTQHATVAQLRSGLPREYASVIWFSFGRPDVNTFVPYYTSVHEVPESFHFAPGKGDWQTSFSRHFDPAPGTFDYRPQLAFWIFNDLENIMGLNYYKTIGEIQTEWQKQEKEALALQPAIEATAEELRKADPDRAVRFLRDYSFGRFQKALTAARKLTVKVKSELYR